MHQHPNARSAWNSKHSFTSSLDARMKDVYLNEGREHDSLLNFIAFTLQPPNANKLQRVQNAAARVVFQESTFCRITPLLLKLTLASSQIPYRL